MMRKFYVSMAIAVCACAVLCGCATSEERAAQKAEMARNVTKALNERNYKISILRMNPMRGSSRSVSYGYSVEVRNDTLFSYLPYFWPCL